LNNEILETQKIKNCEPDMVAHTQNTSYSGGRGRRMNVFKATPGKVSKILSQKPNTDRKAGGVAQVVKYFSRMFEAQAPVAHTRRQRSRGPVLQAKSETLSKKISSINKN
jgi:hypothetical protein